MTNLLDVDVRKVVFRDSASDPVLALEWPVAVKDVRYG